MGIVLVASATDESPFHQITSVEGALARMLAQDNCTAAWPNVSHCVEWWEDDDTRYCLSNGIPPYEVKPYCPFGVGKGYCMTGKNHDKCAAFFDWHCPRQNGAPPEGDVPVFYITLYGLPLNPDPTRTLLPLPLYAEVINPLIWYYNDTDDSGRRSGRSRSRWPLQQINPFTPGDDPSGGMIAVHINGNNIKGPEEAEGVNIDMSGIPLHCGGHVTPPVGIGPQYHYHKASTCLMDDMADIAYHAEDTKSSHSDLVAFANDGHGIYGFYDLDGAKPVVDECNGHFGCLDDDCSRIEYHYHTFNYTYNGGQDVFTPYWVGCYGPSKGLCSKLNNGAAPHCGKGCDYEVCVQPGTDKSALDTYLDGYDGGSAWLNKFTVNPY